MAPQSELPIIIAGGGPVGFITALALARQGLSVQVFEAEDRVSDAPRAATLHASTLEMLADLDLIDAIIGGGLMAPRFRMWDRGSRQVMAEFDFGMLRNDTPYPFVVQFEQHKLANLAIERLQQFPSAKVEFNARVASLRQLEGRVQATVSTRSGSKTVTGRYLIGADGGRSTVRKALGIDFEGYTHAQRFLVLTTNFDFGAICDQCFRNYFSDPDEWFALFKVAGNDGRGWWRALFPTRPEETDAQAMDREIVDRRLQSVHAKNGSYPIVHCNIYRVHQRVAACFRSGRAFLVGDASHVNNPLGGLGLNSGIHDAIALCELLGRVIRHQAPETILDRYDQQRRPLNVEYVQRETINNKKRMEERDPATRAANFAALRHTVADPVAHRAYLLRASLLDSVRRQHKDTKDIKT